MWWPGLIPEFDIHNAQSRASVALIFSNKLVATGRGQIHLRHRDPSKHTQLQQVLLRLIAAFDDYPAETKTAPGNYAAK